MVNSRGLAIRLALDKIGKPQTWLAEQMGVSDNAVSKWIRSGKIARERVAKLAHLLDLRADTLLDDYERYPPPTPPEPPAPQTVEDAQRLEHYALLAQIETLRGAVHAIAAAYGVDAADLVSTSHEAQMRLQRALARTRPADDDMVDSEMMASDVAGDLPRARPTLIEAREAFAIEVRPDDGEPDARLSGQLLHRERRS